MSLSEPIDTKVVTDFEKKKAELLQEIETIQEQIADLKKILSRRSGVLKFVEL